MTPEEARVLVDRQARAWVARDLDAIAAMFAPEGLFATPGGTWTGPEAIREAAAQFFAVRDEVQVQVTSVVVNGDLGAAEWTWREHDPRTGRWSTMHDAVVFEVRDGLVTRWREYFDPAEPQPASEPDAR